MSRVISVLKGLSNSRLNSPISKTVAYISFAALVMVTLFSVSYSEGVNKELSDNLIRLHIIANSDSAEDQALKRDVRDVIINYMKTQLKSSENVEESKNIVNANLANIERIAIEEIKRQKKDYPVKAVLGNYPFPTKSYGDVTLPAGNYEALRVVIGKGDGANWWCVLFPPLCFVDATHGTVPEHVKEDLRKALTQDEYNIITTTDNEDDIPVRIRFKVVEFFQDSKIKFTGAINKVFK